MFHQVFICNPDDEEEAHTEQDFKAHTEQDFKAHTEQDFKEEDDVGAEPAELEVKQETQELKLETSDLKVETKPWVDSVYSDLVQVMKREPVCSDLVQEMKLEPKPEPGLEEPYEILPDIEPEEDKEGLRRKFTVENSENFVLKTLIPKEEFTNKSLTNSIEKFEYKHVLHSGKIEKNSNQNIEEQTEVRPKIGKPQNRDSNHVLSENCIAQNIKPDLMICGGRKENEDIHVASSSLQTDDALSHSENSRLDDEVSVSSEVKIDSGSDWEQNDQTLSEGQTCLKNVNVKERTNARSKDNVSAKSVYESVTIELAQENQSNMIKLPSNFHSYVEKVSSVSKVVGSNQDVLVINKNKLVCIVCNKVLENLRQLRYHVKRSSCSKNKGKPEPKKPTGNEKSDDQIFICTICKKVFETNVQYICHKKYSLCNGYRRKATCQCDICGKAFSGAEKLENHRNSHTNARPHKCTECDKCFNSTTARRHHFTKEHKKIIQSLYLCSFCGITSTSISHMLAHEETHRLPEGSVIPKPFNCHHCGKGFISRFKLIGHLKEHRKRKCSKCNAELDSKSRLQKHLEVVHEIFKVFTCKTCGKTFNRNVSLRLHQFSHSNVLSFICEICDKGFKMKAHLKQHMITHSDERPISCPECDETFKRPTHLKQHLASAHGKGNKPRKSRTKT